jgi:hypothetical protein
VQRDVQTAVEDIDALHLLVRRLGVALDTPLTVGISSRAVDFKLLTSAEKRIADGLVDDARLAAWLRSRAALKQVASDLRMSPDTSILGFPHRRVSVAHAAKVAIAVATSAPRSDVIGIGLDLAWLRLVRLEAGRFFMSADEMLSIASIDDDEERNRARLRVWTVKKALIKATPHNEESMLTDATMRDAQALVGEAHSDDVRFRYASVPFASGCVSLAVAYADARPRRAYFDSFFHE